MSGTAVTAEDYLARLPKERRAVVAAVRDVVLANLPDGYEEAVSWGMLSYEIPLARYPTTYNRQPLSYVALAAQKRHYALYLMGVYGDPAVEARLREGFAAAGKKLDLGKSCLRFRTLDDLPMEVIAETVAAVTPEAYIARYEAVRKR